MSSFAQSRHEFDHHFKFTLVVTSQVSRQESKLERYSAAAVSLLTASSAPAIPSPYLTSTFICPHDTEYYKHHQRTRLPSVLVTAQPPTLFYLLTYLLTYLPRYICCFGLSSNVTSYSLPPPATLSHRQTIPLGCDYLPALVWPFGRPCIFIVCSSDALTPPTTLPAPPTWDANPPICDFITGR